MNLIPVEERKTPGASTIADIYNSVIPADFDALGAAHEQAMYCGLLAAITLPRHPQVVVEIGTQYGMSTRVFLAVTGLCGGGVVHSTDIDPECGRGRTLADLTELGYADRWHFRCGRSQDLEPLPSDLLYVDGDHSYEAVCSDMERYGKLVRDGGLVILDDYNHQWPGKMRWVDERWDVLEPTIVGPFAIVHVTPERRAAFGPLPANQEMQPLTDMGPPQLKAYGAAFVEAHKATPGGMSIEVGTRRGGSALLFLKLLEGLYPEGQRPLLVSVDPYGGKPYVGGVPGDLELPLYGTDEFVAMKRLLKDHPNHAHFMMRSTDFLERLPNVPYWQDGRLCKMANLSFALLDGEHSAETIREELSLLWRGGWMAPKGVVCVDNVECDPETRPLIEMRYHATFETDGDTTWAIVRGVK